MTVHDLTHARRLAEGTARAVHLERRTVLPVLSGDRPLGVYVIGPDGVQWYRVEQKYRTIAATLAAAIVGAALGLLVDRGHRASCAHLLRADRRGV